MININHTFFIYVKRISYSRKAVWYLLISQPTYPHCNLKSPQNTPLNIQKPFVMEWFVYYILLGSIL